LKQLPDATAVLVLVTCIKAQGAKSQQMDDDDSIRSDKRVYMIMQYTKL